MKYYLSSYKFGNETEKLNTMLATGSRIGHINNAQDSEYFNSEKESKQKEEIYQLNLMGFNTEPLDFRDYFCEQTRLGEKLLQLDGLWVSGGNTFVLRQAMKLSGFDLLFNDLQRRSNFLYAGYSAGICVLSDSLKYIRNVDNPNDFPYNSKQIIWEGLNVFNYGILPHYDSNHFESEAIGKEIQMCIDNKWLFKALRDREVVIIE